MADPIQSTSQDPAALVRASSALSEAEKTYWLGLLPKMNDVQKKKLLDILDRHEKNSKTAETEYAKKTDESTQKYLNQWNTEKHHAARNKRHETEKAYREEEQKKAEELLNQW